MNETQRSLQRYIAPTDEEFYEGGRADKKEEDVLQFLCFYVDDEEYALELSVIAEIIKLRDITDVPHIPDFMAGIISLRGEIIYIMNLQKRLSLKKRDITPENRIIIALAETKIGLVKMGLMADRIVGVVRVNSKNIEPTTNIQGGTCSRFIKGVIHYKGRLIIMLNLPVLLETEEAAV
ncbi:MAG TPA: chemotaxis protein CheW [Deltaproteobacteria bacterium]|nr:chemotaxis protein CheW [Deltaproteobacteria bacterium]HCY18494.1 chemotaxis protein CheW [Deltaproteobacteria bacterium]